MTCAMCIDAWRTFVYHGGMKLPPNKLRVRHSYRLTPKTGELVRQLQDHLNLTATSVIELAVGYLAHANNISVAERYDAPRNGAGKAK